MTDIDKVGIPPVMGQNDREVLTRVAESVNMLQGATSQAQRAVRVAEFEARMAAVEARLVKAGF